MFHIMDKKMSVVFKEEITELKLEIIVNTSPVSKELKTTVIVHVPVSSIFSYPVALLLSMKKFCVRMKHALLVGR